MYRSGQTLLYYFLGLIFLLGLAFSVIYVYLPQIIASVSIASSKDGININNAPFGDTLPPFLPEKTHREIYSVSTLDKVFIEIDFGEYDAINPNIIPHPDLENTWIMVGMLYPRPNSDTSTKSVLFSELVCNAVFVNGKLSCIKSPSILPIAATYGDKCVDGLKALATYAGPHDGRVFYSPKNNSGPFIIYGSNSQHTCFGQWVQDFRTLVDWVHEPFSTDEFRIATELQRPPGTWNLVEKNWFLFWDKDGVLYVHYDVAPKRSFAKLEWNSSVGHDLAHAAAHSDKKCMAKYFPKLPETLEGIHQATNSLSITMCKRSDRNCHPDGSNTFIFTIFQHKAYYQFHSVYEPYVMVFKNIAPFEIHGISSKPIWVSGRAGPGRGKIPDYIVGDLAKTWSQTEMFYITSMSWKQRGQKYHGYLDDVLFLAFGIEDSRSGVIDVLAKDLMYGLGLCSLVS